MVQYLSWTMQRSENPELNTNSHFGKMVFRVWVFGDFGQEPERLREWVEGIQDWRGNITPWEIVVPKCNALLQHTQISALTDEQRQEFLVRCAIQLDLEWDQGEA